MYDAIVIGARCAGSPTAMLLARKGYRVLVVDRATFPSDTLSTHVVQPLAAAAGAPGNRDAPVAYCPRRTILDKLLVDAAAEAGADVREGLPAEFLAPDNVGARMAA